MSDELRKQVMAELEQLQQLIELHRPLFDRDCGAAPAPVEISALGAMLHSFCNGVENIFRRVALQLGGKLPDSPAWHRDLLEVMTQRIARRPALISEELRDQLKEYMHFHHVFRSTYSFLLEWEKMAPLIQHCEETFARLRADLEAFQRQVAG